MRILRNNIELQEALKEFKKNRLKIGFVATMGALHDGHLELVKKCHEENDVTIVSIFVNPKQFNNKEDFEKYPVTTEKDTDMLTKSNCDILFLPLVEEIYPEDFNHVKVDLGILDKVFEGPKRPGHFDGVVQVVSRLFELTKPDTAYFGLKDYQQCMVIKALRNQLYADIELKFCPTIRMSSGLAMSSRNMRLSKSGLEKAAYIYKSLKMVQELKKHIEPSDALKYAVHLLDQHGFKIEYFSLANADSLIESRKWLRNGKNIVLAAVWLEGVRLIDNHIF